MSTNKKQIVYIDPDDDITAIIDHLKQAEHKIVALVLPKRAEALKSVVNMKLLKRASQQASRQAVIITKDESVHRIAGSIGLYVAETLNSKPAIPKAPVVVTAKPLQPTPLKATSANKKEPAEPPKSSPLAAAGAEAASLKGLADEQIPSDASPVDSPAKQLNRRLRVPDFSSLRKRIVIAVAVLVLLPLAWFVMYRILPSGRVVISTNARSLSVSHQTTLNASATEVDNEKNVLPATGESSKQQLSEKVVATGEREVGNKASGQMTVSNCSEQPVNIPAGTVFSSGTFQFTSQAALQLDSGNFTGGGVCKSTGTHVKTATVTAAQPGDQYNLGARSYQITGAGGNVKAAGGNMSGGSSEKVKVVTQADIDTAVSKLEAQRDDAAAKTQLVELLKSGDLIALEDSFTTQASEPRSTVAVDQEATEGNITIDVSYSMLGVKEVNVLALIKPQLEQAAGTLAIIDSGIAKATYKVSKDSGGNTLLSIDVNGSAGLVLSEDDIFQQITGLRAKEAAADLRQREGVTQVEISTSPFWITKVPGNRNKVSIEINGAQ